MSSSPVGWCASDMRDASRLFWFALTFAAIRIVALGLSVLGYGRVRAALDALVRERKGPPLAVERSRDRACAVDKLVTSAARGVPRVACLPRSLVTSTLLAREGIETVLRIGVRRDGGILKAHAWVEHLGFPLGDPEDVAATFAPFDRDFGSGTLVR